MKTLSDRSFILPFAIVYCNGRSELVLISYGVFVTVFVLVMVWIMIWMVCIVGMMHLVLQVNVVLLLLLYLAMLVINRVGLYCLAVWMRCLWVWTGAIGMRKCAPSGCGMCWHAALVCDWSVTGFFARRNTNILIKRVPSLQLAKIKQLYNTKMTKNYSFLVLILTIKWFYITSKTITTCDNGLLFIGFYSDNNKKEKYQSLSNIAYWCEPCDNIATVYAVEWWGLSQRWRQEKCNKKLNSNNYLIKCSYFKRQQPMKLNANLLLTHY